MRHRIVLIIGGGIAAYKCLEVIRRLKEQSIDVRVVLTKAAQEFVTALSVGALSNERVFTDLFDLNDEREIGHIRLSREANLVVVAPATADLIAKMAGGHANDLATAVLLATDKPVLIAPAMNPKMWAHPATGRNVATLKQDGVTILGPNVGEMAERDEAGPGRLVEPAELVTEIQRHLAAGKATTRTSNKALAGRHVVVTSGPTHEPLDPVRYLANRSSGKQGYAIAQAAALMGAQVTLVSGPVAIPAPDGVSVINVETAQQMHDAVHDALPADIAIFAAAVADWRADKTPRNKIKKTNKTPPTLKLVENKDILKSVGTLTSDRPRLVIGFAAETASLISNAKKKLKSKGADFIVANDVSPGTGVMGGDENEIHIVSCSGTDTFPKMSKEDVALHVMERAAQLISKTKAPV